MIRCISRLPLLRSAAWIGLLLAAVPSTSAAQIELATFAGFFTPTAGATEWTSVTERTRLPGVTLPEEITFTISTRHNTSVTVGARLTAWLSRRVGVEAGLACAPSSVELAITRCEDFFTCSEDYEVSETLDAMLLAATARALVRFPLPSDVATLHVTGGLGVLNRSGDGYDGYNGTSELVSVFGFGMNVRISESLAIRLDLEDYVSSPSLSYGDYRIEDHFQHNLVISSSLGVSLSGE